MIREAPADQAVRDRLINDLDSTFFVEAGAGTGKTTTVVRRIVALVARGRLEIKGLAAITFTEAAAAELRVRVREALEKAAREDTRSDAERDRCREAVRSMEDATIDTIHAFAAYILKTFPLEAGLPPGFEVMESIQEQLEFHDRFRAWFDNVAATKDREIVARSLLLGLEPKQIRQTALALQTHYDLLRPGAPWSSASRTDAVEVAHSVGRRLRDLLPLLDLAPEVGLPVHRRFSRLQGRMARLVDAISEEDALRALLEVPLKASIPGSQDGWGRDAVTGENAFKVIKREFKETLAEAADLINAYRQNNLAQLLGLLSNFLMQWANLRKAEGRATYHDLLTWARDVVRDNPEVRARLQRHFTRIFVDEFQDTDPLQAELVMYLAAQEGQPLPEVWQSIQPVPGKLFIVGDPKQSIYRFRRADIALYQSIQGQLGVLEKLTSNFRSVPSIIDWVNLHFSDRIQHQPGAQPPYSHLSAEVAGHGPAVWSFGGLIDADQGAVWQAEAEGVAAAARRAIAEGWPVAEGEEPGRTRPARYSDITLLIPSRTNLARIQRAFEAADVPYRLESGELVLATQEIRDLLSCLRSMDDPSDQVALVAALRSPIYGCSDVDLLLWREGGGRLSYEWLPEDPALPDAVRLALVDLASWHRRRHEMTVASLLEMFIDERMLPVATLAQRRPQDFARRYAHLVERARTFATAGRSTLRSFLDWMDDLRDENQAALPGPPERGDDDAVRVMTVHGAKGLEFPIVIMTGWHSKRSFQAPNAIADRTTGRIHVATGAEKSWKTIGYEGAADAERALNDAELIRMVYVAATRAKDHLLVSLYRRSDEMEAGHLAKSLVGVEHGQHMDGGVEDDGQEFSSLPAPPDFRVSLTEEEWVSERTRLLGELAGPRLLTATGLAHADDEEVARSELLELDAAKFVRGRGGTALGRAVHAVLQVLDLSSLDDLDDICTAAATAEGVPERRDEVARLVSAAAGSPAVRRAATSGRYWREVPIGVLAGEAILEGYIDLIFEGPDGLEIVDYKTDDVSAAEVNLRMEGYSRQGLAYRDALMRATGCRISTVIFIFAKPSVEVAIGTD